MSPWDYQRCIDHANKVNVLTIVFSNHQGHCLKRVTTKFEVFDKAYVCHSFSVLYNHYVCHNITQKPRT